MSLRYNTGRFPHKEIFSELCHKLSYDYLIHSISYVLFIYLYVLYRNIKYLLRNHIYKFFRDVKRRFFLIKLFKNKSRKNCVNSSESKEIIRKIR